VTLSDLGEVNRGRSRHRPRYAAHLYGGQYPFIQTGDIKASGGRITHHTQTYSEAGLAQSRLWPAGTMCITIAANIAETALLTYPACFPDSVIGFIADPEKDADVHFIEYVFRYLRSRIQGVTAKSGTAQDNINLEFLERLRFPVPHSLHEQRAIAGVLGALDDKIEVNRKTARVLEGIARAVFTSWFVDFDPVRRHPLTHPHGPHAAASSKAPAPTLPKPLAALFPTRLVDSPIGEVPEGWRVEGIDANIKFLNGLALQKFPPKDGRSLPVIKIAQLRKGDTDGADRASADLDPEYIVQDGDVLFSWSGSLECVLWAGGPGALNQHLFKVTSATLPKWFYYLWVHHHLPDFRHIAAGKATTMGHIQRHHLTQALVTVPNDPRLTQAMDQFFAPLIDALSVRAVQNRTLAALRDALLPKLISGELRIADAEKIVGRAV
jgi:type I restriction enzyme S subunit